MNYFKYKEDASLEGRIAEIEIKNPMLCRLQCNRRTADSGRRAAS